MGRFKLVAEVSSDSPAAVRPVLDALGGALTETPEGYRLEAVLEGEDARTLNRELLSALRRAERRTRIRSEWSASGTTYRFFDYVPKGSRPVG
jgi:hypothetical protein